jgi:hypothetical protein
MNNFLKRLGLLLPARLAGFFARSDEAADALERMAEVVVAYESMNGVLLAHLTKTNQLHKRHVECSKTLIADNSDLRELLFKSQMHCRMLENDLRALNPSAPSLDMKSVQPMLDLAARESLSASSVEIAESNKAAKELLERISQMP